MSPAIKNHKGFSMIEILIALVILAIGLLGMATLMINSVQNNQSAALRSAATLAAYDLAERMRSNTDEKVLKDKKYEISSPRAASSFATINKPSDICHNCTPEALAKHDLTTWAYALNQAVPGAEVLVKSEGTITLPDGTAENRRWCIAIFWEDVGGKDMTKSGDKACGQSHGKLWAFNEVKVLL